MFVAYLDHPLPGIRIQDRDCWYLEVGTETETSKGMVSGISWEGGRGIASRALRKSRTYGFRVGHCPAYRSGFPALCLTGLCEFHPTRTVNIRKSYVNECHRSLSHIQTSNTTRRSIRCRTTMYTSWNQARDLGMFYFKGDSKCEGEVQCGSVEITKGRALLQVCDDTLINY